MHSIRIQNLRSFLSGGAASGNHLISLLIGYHYHRSLRKVLIVDDNDSIRRTLRQQLHGKNGLSVCGEAADGVDAIEQAKRLKPDLVLLDLSMPKLNGAAAASVLKQHMPNLTIILFTMYGGNVRALAPAVGVDIVLDKSDGVRNLVRRIEEILQPPSSDESVN